MKKIILGITCALLCACTDDNQSIDLSSKTVSTYSCTRTYAEALAIAQGATNLLGEDQATRSNLSAERIVDENDVVVISKETTRADIEDSTDTLLYVFNYQHEEGFAIVSANRNTEALIGVTESGHYVQGASENKENGMDVLIALSKQYVSTGSSKSSPDSILPYFVDDTTYVTKFPLIKVKWSQSHPEGEYCPNGISGCGPTAVAQLMSYYKYPTSINLTYEGADMSVQNLDWVDMCKHKLYYLQNGLESFIYCNASDSAHHAIGRLCRQIGELANCIYYPNKTTTFKSPLLDAILSLGYTVGFWTNYTEGTTIPYINQNRPMLFCGRDTVELNGHVWVIDGYKKRTINRKTQYIYNNGSWFYYPPIITYYNHINWGWAGCNNGYFLDNIFDITQAEFPDSGPYSSNDSYNFNYEVEYVIAYPNDN